MKIATWNLESVRPLTSPRRAAFLTAMREVDADVWVLTETWADLVPLPDYQPVVESGAAEDLTPDRRWVAIWVKKCVSAERQDIRSQPDRMGCARIKQPGQSDLVVVGTVLPWPNDRQWPGATGFCEALDGQAGEWERLRGTPDTSTLVVAGDFNQSVPYVRYFGSTKGATALLETLTAQGLFCLTPGIDPLTDTPRIDHICISRSGFRPPFLPRIDTWKVPRIGEKPITDHAGVSADLP